MKITIQEEIRRIWKAIRKSNKVCTVTTLPDNGCNGQAVIYESSIYFWNGTSWVTYAQTGFTTIINVVNTYSNLPDPTTVSGQFFFVQNNQGTKWLPGSLEGTFYAKGLYYSNGVSWIYGGEFPINATQIETDAGVIVDKFVSPNTLYNFVLWGTKQNNIQFQDEGSNLGTTGTVDTIDFVGSNVTASRTGDTLTVTITGGSASGTSLIDTYIAGETINGGKAVIIDTDGLIYNIDITDTSHAYKYLGIAVNAANIGDPVNVVSYGKTDVLGSGWIAGQSYFISNTSYLSTTPPTVGYCKQVGVGVTNDIINIGNYSNHILI